MSEQEKARDVARLLTAWAEKKTLQYTGKPGEWIDYASEKLPVIPVPSLWRIKPEPRRKWQTSHSETFSAIVAAEWKAEGYTVTEWQEVVS
jgi:hypothetical protein